LEHRLSGTLVDFPGARDAWRVVIAGGGITGLAAAHALMGSAREGLHPIEVRVLEAGPRPGGLVRTESVSGLLLETGADSMIVQKPAGLALCERLGLADDLVHLDAPRPTMQIVHRGRLVDLPAGFALLAPTRIRPLLRSKLFSWPGKLRMLAEPLMPRRRTSVSDESLRSFVTRRLGKEAFERAAEPIVGSLYTADADRLSLAATMPRFLELESRHRSLIRGLRRAAKGRKGTTGPGFVWLRGGMERLVERLVAELPPGALALGARVERMTAETGTGRWRIDVVGKPPLFADAVILATPGFATAKLLAETDDTLARDAAALDYASCATVHLLYRASQIEEKLSSFGFFVPRTEKLRILGCSYVSEKFPGRAPADRVLLRAFLGGALDPSVLERTDDERVAAAHEALAKLLRIDGEPELARAHAHPRSMPQYEVGDRARIARLGERLGAHGGLFLAGSLLGAVGVPDCIDSGERAADRALGYLAAFRMRTTRIARA
jgi:oxygen-dependent protoporphyrinogen oxidase